MNNQEIIEKIDGVAERLNQIAALEAENTKDVAKLLTAFNNEKVLAAFGKEGETSAAVYKFVKGKGSILLEDGKKKSDVVKALRKAGLTDGYITTRTVEDIDKGKIKYCIPDKDLAKYHLRFTCEDKFTVTPK